MTKLLERLGRMLTTDETWIFLGLILGFSLWRVPTHQWSDLVLIVGRYCLELSPVLAFKGFQPFVQRAYLRQRVNLLRLIVFCIYPCILVFIDLNPPRTHYFQSSDGDILLVVFLVETLLVLRTGLNRNQQFQTGVYRLGFDRALLMVFGVSAFYLAALMVSNLSGPYQDQTLASEVRWAQVGTHFWLFLGWGLQLLGFFMAGFLIYWVQRYLLVEQVLARAGWIKYLIASTVTLMMLYPLLTQLFLWLPVFRAGQWLVSETRADPFSWRYGMMVAVAMVISLPVVLALQWQQEMQRANELEKERIRTERDMLKQQISPHFLFNTLNNLYALCLKKSDQAPEVVLQLSDLMRYVVYEGRKSEVLVTDEVAYLRDYIGLFQLRRRQQVAFEFEVQIADATAKIAPLLLIIPVENAFKHGIEAATEAAFLKLSLVEERGVLRFRCENSIIPNEETPAEAGVGLENLKKRLALLYPKRHTWTTTARDGVFIAELTIRPPAAGDTTRG
ncbi:sensor histidine kinase [Acanthopleuribacter pedis]|uniref:Histidine kinase n=1 Tax=Acanthopleuribacter pedis TaxID=442870 RepID=A0A8J7QG74_9BACT|nr:histidine kinase [Acanthopleuribacter pedis]MBO1319460.1 histidine kinase [Acanthopleuribacter pedis]